ncbi:hypothetical protein DJ82_12110 [Halorubrum sp. Ib24]|nr:hypothetical protein DJ82_12110 [Halorubrum sp. Ib24]
MRKAVANEKKKKDNADFIFGSGPRCLAVVGEVEKAIRSLPEARR